MCNMTLLVLVDKDLCVRGASNGSVGKAARQTSSSDFADDGQ